MRLLATITLLGTYILTMPANAEQYYKWVDSKGVTNYSAKPPVTGAKKQKISTIDTYTDGSRNQKSQRQFQSNSEIPNTQYQYYNNNSNTQPNRTAPQRSDADEAFRQKAIKEASTVLPGSKGLTANQRNTLAAMNGGDNSGGGYRPEANKSYSAPIQQRQTSSISNCDSSGCWGSDGTRYNRGAGATYFPSTGGSCQSIGGQMQCN